MHSQTEDRDEILQLLYRYNHAIDGDDAEGWADTFTEDGSLDAAGQLIAGREGLVEFASSVVGLRHLVANPVVEISGDTAAVRAYLLVFMGTAPAMIGTYEDDLVRTPAGWRFAKRVFTIDPPT
jgi:hypothetical protein